MDKVKKYLKKLKNKKNQESKYAKQILSLNTTAEKIETASIEPIAMKTKSEVTDEHSQEVKPELICEPSKAPQQEEAVPIEPVRKKRRKSSTSSRMSHTRRSKSTKRKPKKKVDKNDPFENFDVWTI